MKDHDAGLPPLSAAPFHWLPEKSGVPLEIPALLVVFAPALLLRRGGALSEGALKGRRI